MKRIQPASEQPAYQIKREDVQAEIEMLSSFNQSTGLDIRNLLDMSEHQLNEICYLQGDIAPEISDKLLNHVFMTITLIRQIRNLVPDQVFLSIESLLYSFEQQRKVS